MNEEIEKLADVARNSISNFCMNECHAFCCREGYILIHYQELDLMATKKLQEKLEKDGTIRELWDGKFSLNFSNSKTGCPALKKGLCKIHSNPKRPNVCKNFPIFIDRNEVKISKRCLAVQKGMLEDFREEAKELGYEII